MATLSEVIDGDISGGVFYDTALGFAVDVTTTGGTFPGLFDSDYAELDPGGELGLQGAAPAVWMRSVNAPPEGSIVTIKGADYSIVEPQPNSDGETLLRLRSV